MNKEFKVLPNGFESWAETHHEIVSEIARQLSEPEYLSCGEVVYKRLEQQGTGGLYELGIELTDKFELAHEGQDWDGDWLDELEKFLEEELN